MPVKWAKFVPVEGQPLPVPEQWLDTDEARIAHNLKLPDVVPKPVPFDFKAAGAGAVFTSDRKIAVKYFDHLCRAEAGEWIVKKIKNVEGLYFARPQDMPSDDLLKDPYGPEAPWVQRHYQLRGGSLDSDGQQFVSPPSRNYRFVEQPRRRDVNWQAAIREPYIRLHGYTREAIPVPGVYGKAYDQSNWYSYREMTPMRVDGIAKLTAQYGYTWRGLRRVKDREYGIAGGELIIYDIQTKEVLAARRTFQVTGKNPRGPGDALWLLALTCADTFDDLRFDTIAEFAGRVLNTTEPSSFGRK
ncbi:hypothetical protein [Methylibium sp. Pch-M]|uniref:hypothetical protein n=1 Tax=Methylibium sp. Pch-M TaxID=2082386 RepID=UPI0010115906|nr:hypothetical protein [Methylibium sp. Pch-M]